MGFAYCSVKLQNWGSSQMQYLALNSATDFLCITRLCMYICLQQRSMSEAVSIHHIPVAESRISQRLTAPSDERHCLLLSPLVSREILTEWDFCQHFRTFWHKARAKTRQKEKKKNEWSPNSVNNTVTLCTFGFESHSQTDLFTLSEKQNWCWSEVY